jgi:5-methylcytosine-specific restriction endonuclease McrA
MNRSKEILENLDAIQEQLKNLSDRQVHLRVMKTSLQQELLDLKRDDESLKKAHRLYWRTDVRVAKIAEFLGIPNVNLVKLVVGPGSTGLACQDCRAEFVFEDRQQAKRAAQEAQEKLPLCKACITKRENRKQELHTMPYELYLQTPEWKQRRQDALDRARKACQLCNCTTTLEVHHRTYKRRGFESDHDLIVLCRSCHEKHHDVFPITEPSVAA